MSHYREIADATFEDRRRDALPELTPQDEIDSAGRDGKPGSAIFGALAAVICLAILWGVWEIAVRVYAAVTGAGVW